MFFSILGSYGSSIFFQVVNFYDTNTEDTVTRSYFSKFIINWKIEYFQSSFSCYFILNNISLRKLYKQIYETEAITFMF